MNQDKRPVSIFLKIPVFLTIFVITANIINGIPIVTVLLYKKAAKVEPEYWIIPILFAMPIAYYVIDRLIAAYIKRHNK